MTEQHMLWSQTSPCRMRQNFTYPMTPPRLTRIQHLSTEWRSHSQLRLHTPSKELLYVSLDTQNVVIPPRRDTRVTDTLLEVNHTPTEEPCGRQRCGYPAQ
ncbi:hypothetical protein AMTR_s00147p00074310 [Amborella trichopoda]|uniref:Uncharacterized protein n=1 Tax=Amborella trichopoda TaxID=13333 RepID=W1P9K8_AMBTC|nr:hypothetical protein AMTR_s00147p00074310 [Amborella trichopoda]